MIVYSSLLQYIIVYDIILKYRMSHCLGAAGLGRGAAGWTAVYEWAMLCQDVPWEVRTPDLDV